MVERDTLQDVAKREVSEEPNKTAIGLRTPAIMGACDNPNQGERNWDRIHELDDQEWKQAPDEWDVRDVEIGLAKVSRHTLVSNCQAHLFVPE